MQPPLVEHLDSLLTGTGRDLDLQTFKVVDPLSGRMLGVRADITPQVARIDAHLLNEPGVTRLCYAGSVLRTVAARPGADARGDADRRRALRRAGHRRRPRGDARCCCRRSRRRALRGLHLDLGHVGVYRALANGAGIAGNGDDSELFAALRAKDVPAVRALTAKLPAAWRDALRRAAARCTARRDEVLARARARSLPDTPAIANALAALAALAAVGCAGVSRRCTSISPTCAAITTRTARSSRCSPPASPAPIGNGGRYDGIGKAFGRARPATGFTLDLRQLADVAGARRPRTLTYRRAIAWARTSSSSAPSGATKARARSSTG